MRQEGRPSISHALHQPVMDDTASPAICRATQRGSRRCARRLRVGFVVWLLACSAQMAAAEETISVIDLYGLRTVTREAVLAASKLNVGDPPPDFARQNEIVGQIQAVPGVKRAAVAVIHVACSAMAPDIKVVVYIGVDESAEPPKAFLPAPASNVTLTANLVDAYQQFERAFAASFRAGNFSEDFSQGHSLLTDPAVRVLQERFVPLAVAHLDLLIEVLKTSSNARHRAIAAWILGYSTDKQAAARELAIAAHDSDRTVRNNAMRGLAAILYYAERHPELAIIVPPDPFIDMLDALAWTDRNKAMAVLIQLTEGAEGPVVAKLRERSLPTLAEMARWQCEGHATMAYLLLGRAAGLPESETLDAWQAGKRESVIVRAIESRAAPERANPK